MSVMLMGYATDCCQKLYTPLGDFSLDFCAQQEVNLMHIHIGKRRKDKKETYGDILPRGRY